MRAMSIGRIAILLGLLIDAPLARADFPAAVPLDPGGVSRDPVHASTLSLAVTADGAHVYALEEDTEGENDVSILARDAGTGRLGLASAPSVDVSPVGHSFALAPDGGHVYVAHSSEGYGNLIEILTRNPVTGGLTPAPGAPPPLPDMAATDITVSPDSEHVYVADYHGRLVVYDRNTSTGALTLVETETDGVGGVDGLANALSVVVSPDGAHVYVAGADGVAVFARNAGTGAVSFVEVVREGVGGVTGIVSPTRVAISPDGAHVFVISSYYGTVAVFARNVGTGVLSEVEVQQNGVGGVTGMAYPNALIASADGAYVYVLAADDIVIFARNAGTGALTFVIVQPDAGVAAGALAFGPGDDQLYAGGVRGVAHFDRDSGTGLLTSVGAVVTGWPRDLAVSPDGDNVYVTGGSWSFKGAYDFVSVFARDGADGSVDYVESQVQGAAGVQTLAGAAALTVSPDGAHVYVAGAQDGTVTVFERTVPGGTLTLVEAQEDGVAGVDGLGGARELALSPDGAHLYVAGQADNALAVFARNAVTGALTFVEAQKDGVAGVDGLVGPFAVAVSPDGAHVYASTSTYPTYDIVIFARNPVSGALTFVAKHDGHGGATVISPDGLQVYASIGGVTVLARNASTGLLTFVQTFAQGDGEFFGLGGPLAIAPDGTHVYAGGMAFVRDASTGMVRLVGDSGLINYYDDFFTSAAGVSPDGRDVYYAVFPGLGPAFYDASPGIVRYATRGFSGCDAAPLAGCRTAGRGRLRLLTGGGGQLVWSWAKGQATALNDLGDPRGGRTHYALCVYEGPGSTLALRALAPAQGECRRQPFNADPSCWRDKPTGFGYRDDFTSPEGLYTMLLKSGAQDKASMKARARGAKLRLPAMPVTLPVRVQLQAANGECWETTHSTANANDATRFIAPAD
jgi:DNA-binding beta-propeller fold protein YncE